MSSKGSMGPDARASEALAYGLGSWALTMVLALSIICHYRRANSRLQRRVHRLQAGLSSLARSEMRPYAVELEGPIQNLARIQAQLQAGSIEHTSTMEEEQGTLPPPPSPNVPSVRFTTPLDPKSVTKMLSTSPRVDDLQEMDNWANVPLNEFANDTFNHIYGNCGVQDEGTYDLPPPLPPKPAGILKRTLHRVDSFMKTNATFEPHLATDG